MAFFIAVIVQLNVDFVNLDPKTGGNPCQNQKEENEYNIKLSNIATFLIGLIACVFGFSEIRR